MTIRSDRRLLRGCACCVEPNAVTVQSSVSRRNFVAGGLAALGLGAAVAGSDEPRLASAQSAPPKKPHRIDVQHHFSPPQWIAEVKGRELLQPANVNWTPAKSIEDMDKGSVAASMVSVTNPGLWFGDKEMTRRLARECNEFGAKLVQQYPARFGCSARSRCPILTPRSRRSNTPTTPSSARALNS
jgi:6-methylsalicylate decarboxylase